MRQGLDWQVPARTRLPAPPPHVFHAAYEQWRRKHHIICDEQLLHIKDKRVDLHRLHQEVIDASTVHRVSDSFTRV